MFTGLVFINQAVIREVSAGWGRILPPPGELTHSADVSIPQRRPLAAPGAAVGCGGILKFHWRK